jgi:lysophospholipase L1-like esterase
VTNRLAESIIDTQPDHLVLLIGTNDMSQFGSDMQYWLDGIRTVIRTARAHHPGLPITLTTLPPAGRKYSAHARFNPRVVEYNPMIKALAAEEKCSLVDLYAMVVDDEGMLADEYTGDGLHLTRAVYEKWAAELQKR